MTRVVRKRAAELDASQVTAEQAEVIEAELVEELTTDQAEALTTRITACLTNWHAFADTVTELALQAYYGQAFKALGYANWDAYARSRFSLELPRSTQAAINAALINQGAISARSAAAISGTSDKTAAEDARNATAEYSAVGAQEQPVPAGTPLQIVRRERREALASEQPGRSTVTSASGTPDPKPAKRRGADGKNRAASNPKAEPAMPRARSDQEPSLSHITQLRNARKALTRITSELERFGLPQADPPGAIFSEVTSARKALDSIESVLRGPEESAGGTNVISLSDRKQPPRSRSAIPDSANGYTIDYVRGISRQIYEFFLSDRSTATAQIQGLARVMPDLGLEFEASVRDLGQTLTQLIILAGQLHDSFNLDAAEDAQRERQAADWQRMLDKARPDPFPEKVMKLIRLAMSSNSDDETLLAIKKARDLAESSETPAAPKGMRFRFPT